MIPDIIVVKVKKLEKMQVIIQKDVYERGRLLFDPSGLAITVFDVSEEDKMIEHQKNTGTKCMIIGADKYSEGFYNAIAPDSLIVRFGVGYDAVPIEICKKRRILVAFTPGTLDQSVAEYAMALILASARRIPQADDKLKNGEWNEGPGIELCGKTLAILGFGKIGQHLAGVAKNGFGMKINALDIMPQLDARYHDLVDFYSSDFHSAVQDADFVSLHMRVTKETEGFINLFKLELMKKEAILINTARGKLVNEVDLFEALENKIIAGAALDVFNEEPYVPIEGKDLRTLPNIILTPHIASNTKATNEKMAQACINNVINFYKMNLKEVYLVPEMAS